MKKTYRFLGVIGLLGLLIVGLSACGSRKALSQQDVLTNDKASKTITWGVKADTKLFGLMDVKDNTIKGFDADIATAITKKILGKDGKAKFVQVTSQTRIPLLKNGNIDAIIATMTITPEREKQVDFSNSYFDAGQSLLVKKGSSIKSVKDLNKAGTKVIGVTGANSVANIKKYAPKAQVLELSDYAQAMTALKSGQGVALTTDNGILYGMASQNPGYQVVGGAFTKEPYGIAINKGQGPFKKEVNRALKEIEADGTYNRILKKWFGNVAGFNYKEASR
ncbi:glutamate ABC transporter substrate-binding protein [Lactiplantibacillus mudanjiangensis]|uniref:Glutamine ABC transporter substrate-binding protein [Lactobacillus sp.] n=1 Tax=Lactiplantibacillus mudanjiangensis TaxID=1296538 RepID=A0A660DXR1_9LACO|nr:glutamate ABC transporter substrate-binding protein [Lactiplantibacillus mudanjiangensis]VDG17826.1 glutamine ABC transporter substrate-binding protein [Lactobacillus sp.] [Lactiplantibacillus mudanjiangensis]VDG23272.1 glutamine ABC transporter substrate-binding protein [Lactobacillus sp.] [Lactiplantibacillus mudanjiangensis]VDG27941.1 glutamine ABC transporter substrate-binding protein [Lactobacillus sp.] [Lactiplantibacillus mudanjiangensis]VDG32476.1 glutamine ABC transporter substrate-